MPLGKVYKVVTGNENGGAATSTNLLIGGLSQSMSNFEVVALTKGKFYEKLKGKYSNITCIGKEVPPQLGPKSAFYFSRLFLLFMWAISTSYKFRKFAKSNRVEFIHTTNNYALLVCCLVKLTMPNLIIISHWRGVGLSVSEKFKILLPLVNKVIAISNAVKESLPQYLRDRAVVIYNGLEIEDLINKGRQCKGKLRSELGLLDGSILVGTIGTYSPVKCHSLLIDALSYLKQNQHQIDIHCVLIGVAPNEQNVRYKKFLEDKAKACDLSNITFFDGGVADTSAIISDLDIFVGATWNDGKGEGFGLVYVEAMAQSLPVIAINIGAAKEIIDHDETGILINSPSHKDLAMAILELYLNKEKGYQLGKAGLEKAKVKYNIAFTLDKIKRLYNEIFYNGELVLK